MASRHDVLPFAAALAVHFGMASSLCCRVCMDPFGCGMSLDYAVSAAATGLSSDSPTQGGLVGGLVVTILGSGFSNDPAAVRARFGNASCAVQAANATAVVCRIGAPFPPLGNATASSQPLFFKAAANAPELQYPGITFTFTPALTAAVTAVAAASSCPGPAGMPLVITGSNFVSDVPNLQVRCV
jgi:hypothetical protein